MSSIVDVRAVFVSPHLDDVAWSTGSLLWTLVRESSDTPLVVSVFTQEPDPRESLSDFAKSMHELWGGSVAEAWSARRREDTEALQHLGVEFRHLSFVDAMYRGYDGNGFLSGEISSRDEDLGSLVAEALEPYVAGAALFLPLGVGAHVDHELCFRLHERLAGKVTSVFFYEDFPYLMRKGSVDGRIQYLRDRGLHLSPQFHPLTNAAVAAHVDACHRYPSQVASMFSSPDKVQSCLTFALRDRFSTENAQLRYWRFD